MIGQDFLIQFLGLFLGGASVYGAIRADLALAKNNAETAKDNAEKAIKDAEKARERIDLHIERHHIKT